MFLAATSAITLHAPAVSVRTKATVTIECPAKASRQEWERIPPSSRHEKIVRDGHGDLVLLRIVDFE